MIPYIDLPEVDDAAFSKHIDMLDRILVAALHKHRQTPGKDSAWPMLYVDFGDMRDEARL